MKKSNVPLSMEELICYLQSNTSQGPTRIERMIRKHADSNSVAICKMTKHTVRSEYHTLHYTSNFMYYKTKVIVHSFICEVFDDGDIAIGGRLFFVNSEKNGLRYYTIPTEDRYILKFSLHFYNRFCERLLDISEHDLSDSAIAAICTLLDSMDYTINRDISNCYGLVKDKLLVYRKLSNKILELVTFLGEPYGNEQTKVYDALMNYRQTKESLK